MKTLILGGSNSRNSGGVFNSARQLGISLGNYCGTEVEFLMYEDEKSHADKKYYHPLRMHSYQVKGPKKLGYSTNMYEQLCRIRPDLIHIQSIWMHLSYINAKYNSKTGTPYIISTHGMLDSWQLKQSIWKNFKKNIVLQLYEHKHLHKANCIHALCKEEYHAIRNFGLKNPIAIIPNGVDLPSDIVHKQDRALLPWKHDNNRNKTLLFLSRLHRKKGIEKLLDAWLSTRPNEHQWQLVIAGDTPDLLYTKSLINKIKSLNLTESVQLIGGQFDKAKHHCFCFADAFILPSFSEGLPIAVLEAWSYGLVSLITPYCNLPEGVEKKAAIEIEPTVESITEGIKKVILMSENERLAMGLNGFNLVKEKFTWKEIACQTMDLYNWILKGGAPPAFILTS